MRVLRNIVTYINVLFFFLVFTVLFPVYLIFKIFKFESYFVKFSFILMRFGINISLWLADVKVVVTRDNDACLSGKGSVVIMGNHVGAMDPIFLIYIFMQPFAVVAKRSLFNIPFLNLILISIGAIPVNRSSIKSSANAQRRALEVIKEGRLIGIFPEGTRSRDGEVGKFKRGAMNLALRTNSSIIPVTLLNTHKVFIKNFIFNSGLSVYVHVHSLIDVSILKNDEKENLHVIVRDKIVKKLEKMKMQYSIDRDLNEDK
ncbi:1-acyl-sn-glycerol-3-phosphate acyltransferase [Borrelia turcica IST7]|uniref:1-acyl-sn-glycerol-3-phosphate acyltransferase n=1 Tax=Borrelia turcica IST7 TaxID=1104446 RepID=A0A386PKA4_9SPIR|nr:lysophospholipid acyltransferase family protein [Borrelia turcica]AYE35938.1 1-acyl-sn-glycerol-3-phosphate acyltransferase [Borrelia turcica IST7]